MSGFDVKLKGLRKEEIADAIEHDLDGYRAKIAAAGKDEEEPEVEVLFGLAQETAKRFAELSQDDGLFNVYVSAQGRTQPGFDPRTGDRLPFPGRDSLSVYIESADPIGE